MHWLTFILWFLNWQLLNSHQCLLRKGFCDVMSVMCSRVNSKLQGQGPPASSSAWPWPTYICLRELNRVIQAPFLGPLSIDEHSLHQLAENSSEVEPMTCSFKVLFIFLTSILCPDTLSEQVCKQPCGSESSTKFIVGEEIKLSHIPAHQSWNRSPYVEQVVHRACWPLRISSRSQEQHKVLKLL